MKLKPLFNNVIIKPGKAKEQTKSGIVLASASEAEKPERGEVVACGPGKISDSGDLQKMSVKVGDQVVFKKYSPDEVKLEDEDYLVLNESDIVAIIE